MFDEIARVEREHGVVIPTVAHAGDGNLHPNFIFDAEPDAAGIVEVPDTIWDAADDLFRAALRLGGTLTGEHGVGVLKRRWLADELGDDQWELQRRDHPRLRPARHPEPGQGLRAVTGPRIHVSAAVITDAEPGECSSSASTAPRCSCSPAASPRRARAPPRRWRASCYEEIGLGRRRRPPCEPLGSLRVGCRERARASRRRGGRSASRPNPAAVSAQAEIAELRWITPARGADDGASRR